MKKGTLDINNQPYVINRIHALTPFSQGLWGIMTVNDMLFHCATINRAVMKGTSNNSKPTWKQYFLQLLVLKMMKGIPKGIKTNPKYVKPKEDETAFEELQSGLIDSIQKIANHKGDIYGNHPMMGPLQTNQWRRFVYMHLDYHLRQFGV